MGSGRVVGHEVSAETRAKISAALRGRKPVWTGKPRSAEHRAHLSAALRGNVHTNGIGEDHPNWKGQQAGYMAKHNWIRRKCGSAAQNQCQHCQQPAREWANVSGEYRRELGDYIPLCRSCHIAFDARMRANRKVRKAISLIMRGSP